MLDGLKIQYVLDEHGNKTAVQIPFQEWLKLRKELATLLEARQLKRKLKSAFKEVQEIEGGERKGVTLKEFLGEL